MTKTYEAVVKDLNQNIPSDVISKREAGNGMKLDYLEGWYVINRLNETLGIGNWAYTSNANVVFQGEINGRFATSYIASVRLVAELPGGVKTEFTDYGYGDGFDKTSPGKAHELAVKEAVTDGLKRAAKNLGLSMGLALYDKSREFVDTVPAPAPASPKPIFAPVVTKQAQAAPKAVTAAAPARATVNSLISSTSKVLIDKKLTTQDDLVALLLSYGVKTKDQLTDTQAEELYSKLKGMLK